MISLAWSVVIKKLKQKLNGRLFGFNAANRKIKSLSVIEIDRKRYTYESFWWAPGVRASDRKTPVVRIELGYSSNCPGSEWTTNAWSWMQAAASN